MSLSQRDWIVLLAISAGFCIAFLVEPDWNLKEAHLLCAGRPVQVFESMNACSVNLSVGCPCVRPRNPWVYVYWFVFLSGAGIAAALLLRTRALVSAVFIAGAMAVGGYCGFFLLSRRELFEPEAWALAPFVITVYAAFTLLAFGLARLARRSVFKRRSAT
jgi:hypothetical protein